MILNESSTVIEIKKTDIKVITKFVKIIIIFNHFEKKGEDKENENDLNFRIINEKNEEMKRFNVNIKYL